MPGASLVQATCNIHMTYFSDLRLRFSHIFRKPGDYCFESTFSEERTH